MLGQITHLLILKIIYSFFSLINYFSKILWYLSFFFFLWRILYFLLLWLSCTRFIPISLLQLTRRRLCLWHIRKKFHEKLSHIYHKSSNFTEQKKCIRDSLCIKHVIHYALNIFRKIGTKLWLNRIWKKMNGSKVCTILKSHGFLFIIWRPFFARMNTTQRSESINALFESLKKKQEI